MDENGAIHHWPIWSYHVTQLRVYTVHFNLTLLRPSWPTSCCIRSCQPTTGNRNKYIYHVSRSGDPLNGCKRCGREFLVFFLFVFFFFRPSPIRKTYFETPDVHYYGGAVNIYDACPLRITAPAIRQTKKRKIKKKNNDK